MNNIFKRKCVRLTISEKIEIIRYCDANPHVTDNQIASMFEHKFKKQVSRRTINDLRRKKDDLLKNVNLESKDKYRNPILKYGKIDEELSAWIDFIDSAGGIINDSILINKALSITKT